MIAVVALTLTTGSRQVSGVNSKSVGFGARSLGFMHLRVPSGTLIPIAASICACKMDVAGVRSAKTSMVRRRRLFMCVS